MKKVGQALLPVRYNFATAPAEARVPVLPRAASTLTFYLKEWLVVLLRLSWDDHNSGGLQVEPAP